MSRRQKSYQAKPKKKKLSYSIGLIGFFLLMLWEVDLYRQTLVSVWTLVAIYIVGGSISFFVLRSKMRNYKRRVKEYGLSWTILAGIFFSGGIVLTLVMTLNYYIPSGTESETVYLKVLKTGRFSDRHGPGAPYTIVDYNGLEKQLVFDYATEVGNSTFVKASLMKGIFGFRTVQRMHLIYSDKGPAESTDDDEIRAYRNLLKRASEYERQGNRTKAIELYQRALQFNPSDSVIRIHLVGLNASPAN